MWTTRSSICWEIFGQFASPDIRNWSRSHWRFGTAGGPTISSDSRIASSHRSAGASFMQKVPLRAVSLTGNYCHDCALERRKFVRSRDAA